MVSWWVMNNPRLVSLSRPFLLEVFLADRRNMIYEKKVKTLIFDRVKQAVDIISSDKYIQDKFNGQVKITFTGGEPLLEFAVLKEAISYIRTKEPDFEIEVVTNGALLTENRMDFFTRNNVEIALSLDGRAFESVISNLKKGLINKRYMDHFHVVVTLNSQTIDSLSDVVKFFRHDVGFKQLEIGLESHEIWSQAGINRLRNVLRSLKSRFLTTIKHGMDVKHMEFAFREFLFSQCEGADYHELARNASILFCDGYFYPSDFVAKPPLGRKYRVGDIKHGINFKRIGTMSSLSMFTNISRKCECKTGLLSPVERYCWGVVHKFTPDRLNKLLENTSQVNRVFNEEMDCYTRLQKTYERLVMTTSFGDFAHSPKYRSGKEIKNFRLIIRNDSDIVRLREGIDYFLYSPGSAKKLILYAMDDTQTAIDVVEGMVLYVLMKARYLKKRIRLMVACEAGDISAFSDRGGPASCSRGASASGGGWDANRRGYLNEHGVRLGTCFAGGSRF